MVFSRLPPEVELAKIEVDGDKNGRTMKRKYLLANLCARGWNYSPSLRGGISSNRRQTRAEYMAAEYNLLSNPIIQ